MSGRRESLDALSPPAKRRKVRKGTHSCWECRRRKIKCQFEAEDTICIGCKQRGSDCRSQEFDDDNAPESGQKADPPLARRLDKLEQMMGRLVDKIVPEESGQAPLRRGRSGSSPGMVERAREAQEPSVDILETNTGHGPVAALLAMRNESLHRHGPTESDPTTVMTSIESRSATLPATTTPQGSAAAKSTMAGREMPPAKHFWVSTSLRSIIPPQHASEAIVAASPGALYVTAMHHSHADRLDGKVEPASSIADVLPRLSAHPLIFTRRALQILICIQQLPPAFDWDSLKLEFSPKTLMNRLLTTSILVTSNDELVGYAEGLECLLLLGFYQANEGSLRKAWISSRRALSLAQLMGIDRGHSASFRSCDPTGNAATRPSAEHLWYRIVYSDRYLSLLLGLPVGSHSNDFASEEACTQDTTVERLEKVHAVLSARIIERNHTKGQAKKSNYAVTQEIDLELDAAFKSLDPRWWEEPTLDPFAHVDEMFESTSRIINQIHHYTLLILLHLPYMLRDPASSRFDFSKTTCASSAREILNRYITFRSLNVSVFSCRRVDYAALIATMTLLLSYLCRRKSELEFISSQVWEAQCVKDMELVDKTKRRMEHMAAQDTNSLSCESVEIVNQLLPIIDKAAGPESSVTLETREGSRPIGDGGLHFRVPYLGTVNIQPTASASRPSSSKQPSWMTEQILEAGWLPSFNDGFMQFTPDQGSSFPLTPSGTEVALPDLTADGSDWAFQGVDAAYWSLFEGPT